MLSFTAVMSLVCPGCALTITLIKAIQTYVAFDYINEIYNHGPLSFDNTSCKDRFWLKEHIYSHLTAAILKKGGLV